MSDPFLPRPAKEDDYSWPYWFVVRKSMPRVNALPEACKIAGIERQPGAIFVTGNQALAIAKLANAVEQEAPDAG